MPCYYLQLRVVYMENFLVQDIATNVESSSVAVAVADSAEVAMVVTTTTATATAGLHHPCTSPTGTPGTTLPTETPGTTRRPQGTPVTTTMVGAAVVGVTPLLLMAAGEEGSVPGRRCRTPHTGECLREAMVAAGQVAVATTGR